MSSLHSFFPTWQPYANYKAPSRPPPERAVWLTGKYTIYSGRKAFVVPIDLIIDERTQAVKVTSPVNPNIKYPRNMVSPCHHNVGGMTALTFDSV